MRFLIVGFAGGLGAFLSNELQKNAHEVPGIDVVDGPTADSVLLPK